MTNKFNTAWQLVRVDARAIKDPILKLATVAEFLQKNPNFANYERVLNWIQMTGVAYKGDTRALYEKAAESLKAMRHAYVGVEESEADDFARFARTDLERIYKDLQSRKYGFQFNKVPKQHVEYVVRLKAYLDQTAE